MQRRSFIRQSGLATGAALPLISSAKLFANASNGTVRGGSVTAGASPRRRPPNIQAGLEPFTGALTKELAAHLLRRTGFGPRYGEVSAIVGANATQAIANMFAPLPAPAPPGAWVSEAPLLDGSKTSQQTNSTDMQNFRDWWMGLIYAAGYPASANVPNALQEKMVLFWENHFVTEFAKVKAPQYLYWKNTMLRQNAFGNFKDLVNTITIDNAMLWYLDGWTNTKGKSNENYARELMELFTMGPYDPNGNPNYSQTDIVNSGYSLTGWTLYGYSASTHSASAMQQYQSGTFVAALHNTDTKTFLGQSGDFGNTDIVNIIFQQTFDSFSGDSTVYNKAGLFICRKLYGLFVYDDPGDPASSDYSSYCNPTNPIIQQMAVTFAQNDFSIQAVLQQLLASQHFFDASVVGAEIKSPVELVVSAARQLEQAALPADYLYTQSAEITGSGETQLDQPPNVAGFPGYETWISTAALPQRNQFSDGIVSGITVKGVKYAIDPIAFAKLVCDNNPSIYNDAPQLILACAAFLLPFPLDTNTNDPATKISALQTALIGGAAVNDWSTDYPGAAQGILNMLTVMLRLADFQLA